MRTILAILLLSVQLSAQPALGWRSNPAHSAGLTQIAKHPRYRAAVLPTSSSVESALAPVYDQGQLGSCTANAGCGAFDFAWKRQHGKFSLPSRLDLYQSSLKHDGNFPNDEGSYTSTVLFVLKNQGVCQERKWAYNPAKLAVPAPACAVKQRPTYMTIKAYDVPNDDNGASVKQTIANVHIPVMTGGYVYQNIFQPRQENGQWYVPMPQGSPVGGHEILIVGYNDTLTLGGHTGQARIRNSWGATWGDKGCAWVAYDYIFNPKQWEDNGAIEVTN